MTLITALLVCLALCQKSAPHFVLADEVELLDDHETTSDESLSQGQRAEIIHAYFKSLGLSIDLDDHEFDRYEPGVVAKMAEVARNSKNHMGNYRRVCEINSRIHAGLAKRRDADMAVLESFDLIVPRSFSQSILEQAKETILGFHVENLPMASELLMWVRQDLDEGRFHTQDAIRFLEASVHNWVPFGRLNMFIEENGEEHGG